MRKIFNSKSFFITLLALCFGAMPLCVFGANSDVMNTQGGTYVYISRGLQLKENNIIIVASHAIDYSTQSKTDYIRVVSTVASDADHQGLFDSFKHNEYSGEMPSTIVLSNTNSTGMPYEYKLEIKDKETKSNKGIPNDFYTISLSDINDKYISTSGNIKDNIILSSEGTCNIIDVLDGNPITIRDLNNIQYKIGTYNNHYNGYFTNNGSFSGFNTVSIYKKVFPITISEVGYATFYNGTNDVILPEGITAYTYSYNGEKLTIANTIEAGEVLPHGTAVVIKGEPGTYYLDILAAASDNSEQNADNLLRGSDNDATTTAPGTGDYQFYYLANDNGELGFYWGADDGVAFQNKANRAYLCIPTSAGSKAIRFTLPDDSTPATEVKASNTNGKASAYDISGKAFGNKRHSIRIENGKKFMVK